MVTKKFRPKVYGLFVSLGIISFGLINTLLEMIRSYNGFNLINLQKVTFNQLILNFFKLQNRPFFYQPLINEHNSRKSKLQLSVSNI